MTIYIHTFVCCCILESIYTFVFFVKKIYCCTFLYYYLFECIRLRI
jgi:hypothetical protein